MVTQQNVMHCDANRFSPDYMRYDRAVQGMDFLWRLKVCFPCTYTHVVLLNDCLKKQTNKRQNKTYLCVYAWSRPPSLVKAHYSVFYKFIPGLHMVTLHVFGPVFSTPEWKTSGICHRMLSGLLLSHDAIKCAGKISKVVLKYRQFQRTMNQLIHIFFNSLCPTFSFFPPFSVYVHICVWLFSWLPHHLCVLYTLERD